MNWADSQPGACLIGAIFLLIAVLRRGVGRDLFLPASLTSFHYAVCDDQAQQHYAGYPCPQRKSRHPYAPAAGLLSLSRSIDDCSSAAHLKARKQLLSASICSRRNAILLVGAARDDPQGIVRQWPLQRFRLFPRRTHPDVPLFVGRQKDRHRLRMDRRNDAIRLGRQEAVDQVRPGDWF